VGRRRCACGGRAQYPGAAFRNSDPAARPRAGSTPATACLPESIHCAYTPTRTATERPAVYRDAVLAFLRHGGTYRCVLLDPSSEVAALFLGSAPEACAQS
jgi:hypothetical protein